MKLVAVCWSRVDRRVVEVALCVQVHTHTGKQTGTPTPTTARCHILTTWFHRTGSQQGGPRGPEGFTLLGTTQRWMLDTDHLVFLGASFKYLVEGASM